MSSKSRTALVTGAYSAIGEQIARQLAQSGYDLVVTGRDPRILKDLRADLAESFPDRNVRALAADLSDHGSIEGLVGAIRKDVKRLDAVVHNAGVALDRLQTSSAGNDVHFEVNTVAPYLLTVRLSDTFRQGTQIVLVGSSAMRMIRKPDLAELVTPTRFVRFRPYALSKLAGAAAMMALSRDLSERGALVRVCDPGPTRTAMSESRAIPGWFRAFRRLFKSPGEGASRILAPMFDPKYASLNGIYFERGRPARPFPLLSNTQFQRNVIAAIDEAISDLDLKLAPAA